MATNKQTTISELFRKCEKARDDSLVVIEIDPESNNEVDYEETLSGKTFSGSYGCHVLRHVSSCLSLGSLQLLANTEDKSTVSVLVVKYRKKVT